MLSSERVFQLLLAYRLVNSLTVRTFFQPDEYYQALEPAWNSVFGTDSHAWITWEWHAHLRSSLHPALFALAYRAATFIADVIKLEPSVRVELLLAAPKVLQAGIAAMGDFYTWKLGQRIYGAASKPAVTVLALTVLNPWQWFCSTRTFSNGLEMSLTVAALYHWPFDLGKSSSLTTPSNPTAASIGSAIKENPSKDVHRHAAEEGFIPSQRLALVLAAFATLLRPTNIIIWASLTIYALLPSSSSGSDVKSQPGQNKTANIVTANRNSTSTTFADIITFVQNAFLCGSLALLISITLDYWFICQLTFPPINFLIFNVLKSLAVFYGNNDWHYYLSQGYPMLLMTALPFTIVGMYQVLTTSPSYQLHSYTAKVALRGLVLISLTLPACLSVLAHKEVRFIYPLLPTFHVLAAGPTWQFFGPSLSSGSNTPSVSTGTALMRRVVLAILLMLNATIALYTSQIHNSGILSLPGYLRGEYQRNYAIDNKQQVVIAEKSMTVAFLMPCHSIPWRSHLQYPPTALQPGIKAWALTCEPPLHIDDPDMKAKYRDEADLFYDDPSSWVRTNMARSLPEGAIDNRGTHARHKAGVYSGSPAGSKKKLWGRISNDGEQDVDITDLLPYLSTWQQQQQQSSLKPSRSSKEKSSTPNKAPGQEEDSSNPNKNSTTKPKSSLEEASLAGLSPSSARQIRRPWPHYLAFFAQLEHTMHSILRGSGYRECWRTFNSHWHDDWRRTGDIIVWCLRPVEEDDTNDSNVPIRGDGDGVESKQRGHIDGEEVESDVDAVEMPSLSSSSAKKQGNPSHHGGPVKQKPRGDAKGSRDRLSSGQRALHVLHDAQNEI